MQDKLQNSIDVWDFDGDSDGGKARKQFYGIKICKMSCVLKNDKMV